MPWGCESCSTSKLWQNMWKHLKLFESYSKAIWTYSNHFKPISTCLPFNSASGLTWVAARRGLQGPGSWRDPPDQGFQGSNESAVVSVCFGHLISIYHNSSSLMQIIWEFVEYCRMLSHERSGQWSAEGHYHPWLTKSGLYPTNNKIW